MIRHEALAKFKGVAPAIVSPHDGRDRFEPQAFDCLIDFLYAQGVHGLYCCGATGEGYGMRLEERKLAAEIATGRSRGRGTVIVHVGTQGTRDAIELAEHAAANGADAVASIPPMGRNLAQLVAYYGDVARASGLPVLVYHIPSLTSRQFTIQDLMSLLDVPGVQGLKFTDSDLFMLHRLHIARPDVVLYSGSDELFAPALLYGAHGGIGTWYNLLPALFVSIWRSVQAGDVETALRAQGKFLRLADLAWQLGLVETVDLLLRRAGLANHAFRRPFMPFDRQAEAYAASALRAVCRELQLEV